MIFIKGDWLGKKFSASIMLFFLVSSITGILTGCNRQLNFSSQSPPTPLNNQQKSLIFQALDQQKNSLNLCSKQRDQNLSSQSINTYWVNQDQYLVEILCFLGAYQPNYQYFLAQFNSSQVIEFEPVIFTIFQRHKQDLKLTNTQTLTGSTQLDWQNKILTVVAQGRSLGDCGSLAVYKWNDSHFELQEFRHKSSCDGVYLPLEDYPLIYP